MSRNSFLDEIFGGDKDVTPRERRVSRNHSGHKGFARRFVTPRERRVSRNVLIGQHIIVALVTPRERRVSRNLRDACEMLGVFGHASREACE